jgi:cell division transport system permease protein
MEISLKPDHREAPVVEQLADRLKNEKQIAAVEYPQEWVERLELVVLTVGWAKWIFGGVLFMATFFIVSSTAKLAVLARRDEVEIMQLVGASEELIQAPFVLEGMVLGVMGGALSVGALWSIYMLLQSEMSAPGGFFSPLGQLSFLDSKSVALIVVMGWLLGAAGSLFSLRRFVRTWKTSRGEI